MIPPRPAPSSATASRVSARPDVTEDHRQRDRLQGENRRPQRLLRHPPLERGDGDAASHLRRANETGDEGGAGQRLSSLQQDRDEVDADRHRGGHPQKKGAIQPPVGRVTQRAGERHALRGRSWLVWFGELAVRKETEIFRPPPQHQRVRGNGRHDQG